MKNCRNIPEEAFNPASLTHDTLRTNPNRIDAINIPDGLSPACHQLWGQGGGIEPGD
jgi:hypothetical protein